MKKALSLLLVLIIVFSASLPLTAGAVDINSDNGMFDVSVPIEADAYMLVSLDNGNVLAQKNKDKKKYPASLTKIVTTMVTIENVENLDAQATVSEHAVDVLEGTGAQVAGLQAGDTVSFRKLLSLTMVYSACDACQVLAEAVGGNEAAFVKMMNDWAKKVGCKATNFANPDGLHEDNHYTTAADMLLITLAALKNDTFNEIAGETTCSYGGTTFYHTNYLLNPSESAYYYQYASGIKTGTTTQAGNCVITKAQKGTKNYLAIVLDSPMINDMKGSFVDAKALFEWGFNDLEDRELFDTSAAIGNIAVLYGKKCDTLELGAKEEIVCTVPVDAKAEDIKVEPVKMPKSIEAPIKKGDEICKANITYKGQIIAKTSLVASKDVKFSLLLKIGAVIKQGFNNSPAGNIICLIVLLVIIVLIIRIIHVKKVKKKRALERERRRQKMREERY